MAVWPRSDDAQGPASPRYTMAEAAAVARHLRGEGYRGLDLRVRLSGPGRGALSEAMAIWSPRLGGAVAVSPSTGAVPMGEETVRVVRVSNEDAARLATPGFTAVVLSETATALVGPLRSWLDPARATVCVPDGERAACVTLAPADWSGLRGGDGRYAPLAYAQLRALAPLARAWRDATRISVEIPVFVEGPDATRTLVLLEDLGARGRWRFGAVVGVGAQHERGGRRLTLTRGESQSGTVTVEYSVDSGSRHGRGFPGTIPPMVEWRPGEDTLAAALYTEP